MTETTDRKAEREPQHGVASTYTNWGCRCDECRRANTEACRAYRRARRERLAS